MAGPTHAMAATPGKFVDLFAGCGGLSLGLMQAGWEGQFAIERDSLAFETLSYNLIDHASGPKHAWPDWLEKGPHEIAKFIADHTTRLRALRGKVDLIAGGPPCQGFSMAGRRRKDDPRNTLFKHYIEIVQLVEPSFILLENVRGISLAFNGSGTTTEPRADSNKEDRPFSDMIRESLENAGYSVFPRLFKAVEYGVPQLRPRYIVLAIRKTLLAQAKADFDPYTDLEKKREAFLKAKGLPVDRHVTAKQAISDLETASAKMIECVDSKGFKQIQYSHPRSTYQRLMHGDLNGVAPNSLRLAKHREKTKKRFALILATCRHGVNLSHEDRDRLGIKKHTVVALDGDEPSHTLTTLPDDIIHYSEPRILTVREYGRLQSFPDWFEFRGKYTTGGDRRTKECPRYTQAGNAVPPLLAEFLGKLVADLKSQLLPRDARAGG